MTPRPPEKNALQFDEKAMERMGVACQLMGITRAELIVAATLEKLDEIEGLNRAVAEARVRNGHRGTG